MNIPDIVSRQKETFNSGQTRLYETRMKNLNNLRKLLSENERQICDAINRDFGKPYFEAFSAEIFTTLQEIDFHRKNLSGWMAAESVGGTVANFPAKNLVYKQPFGTVLVIGAWNYPVYLALMPVIGALSGGNTVVLKPSEMAPATSAILHSLAADSFDPGVVTVVEGGADETTRLLEQPFDNIFFTGSRRVGKIVMKAAAEQLIPVTLELGGKSPAIVHQDANIPVTAKRIWWGKTMNAGQTCVAPDFVVIHESLKEPFIAESKKVLSAMFQADYQPGKNYSRIVNDDHFNRLKDLLGGCNIIFGGSTHAQTRFIEPALVEAGWDDEIMQDEIFGPILPMLTYRDEENLIRNLRDMSSPLALYLFTDRQQLQDRIIREVPFGGGCMNETVSHLANPNLPFGGIGGSGMGAYHGKYSFDTFTRPQAVVKKNFWPDPDIRYPPYDATKLTWFKRLFS